MLNLLGISNSRACAHVEREREREREIISELRIFPLINQKNEGLNFIFTIRKLSEITPRVLRGSTSFIEGLLKKGSEVVESSTESSLKVSTVVESSAEGSLGFATLSKVPPRVRWGFRQLSKVPPKARWGLRHCRKFNRGFAGVCDTFAELFQAVSVVKKAVKKHLYGYQKTMYIK
jgi:hypothetical protein